MFLATKWGIKDEILACPARFERATYVLDEVALVKLDNWISSAMNEATDRIEYYLYPAVQGQLM